MHKLVLFIAIFTSLSTMAGTLPSVWFSTSSKFGCIRGSRCSVPRADDLEEMKKLFVSESGERIEKINKSVEAGNAYVEELLAISQKYEQEGNSNVQDFYRAMAESLLQKLNAMDLENVKLLVSENSPFLDKISGFQAIIAKHDEDMRNTTDEAKKEEMLWKLKEKWKEMALEKDFLAIIFGIDEIAENFFNQEKSMPHMRWFSGHFGLLSSVGIESCPENFKQRISDMIGEATLGDAKKKENSLDPKKDQKLIKFILSGQSGNYGLKVICKRSGRFGSTQASFSKKKHELTIKWKSKVEDEELIDFNNAKMVKTTSNAAIRELLLKAAN